MKFWREYIVLKLVVIYIYIYIRFHPDSSSLFHALKTKRRKSSGGKGSSISLFPTRAVIFRAPCLYSFIERGVTVRLVRRYFPFVELVFEGGWSRLLLISSPVPGFVAIARNFTLVHAALSPSCQLSGREAARQLGAPNLNLRAALARILSPFRPIAGFGGIVIVSLARQPRIPRLSSTWRIRRDRRVACSGLKEFDI